MPTYKKNILISFIAIVAIGSIYIYKEFNREVENLVNIKPQQTVTASDIINSFSADESRANDKFLGKIISVTGPVSEINDQEDTLVYVLIGNSNDLHRVSCLLDKHQTEKIKQYSTGEQISVKGICTGFLMDVELNRCVIVSPDKK